MKISAPVLIGYFAKKTVPLPAVIKAPQVEEVASVSICIAKAPEEWIRYWKHNELWVFDSPELAWSVVTADFRDGCDLYAYQMYPLRVIEGREEAYAIPPIRPIPLSPAFERLGIDVVSRSLDTTFECSPLSCNHMAEGCWTNRYCLVEDFATALRLAHLFEQENCEPGPYYIVEVWRQNRLRDRGCAENAI